VITFTANVADAQAFMQRQARTIADRLRHALYTGVEEFGAWEIQKEMLGRPGLESHGGLSKSWHADLHGEGFSSSCTWSNNANTWYAVVHQTGKVIHPKTKPFLAWQNKTGEARVSASGRNYTKYSSNWVYTKKSVTIPKRLNIYENWQNRGREMVTKKIQEVLSTT
jgi:hypothetical protein